MKTAHSPIRRLMLAAALAILLAGTLAPVPVSARLAGDELIPNPAAEAYFRNMLTSYGFVDLADFSDDPADRVISGQTFADVLLDPRVKNQVEVFIYNVTMSDTVYLSAVTLDYDLYGSNMYFAGPLWLDGADINGVWISESEFDDDVIMSGIKSSGGINLRSTLFHSGLYLDGAIVNGLSFYGSEFDDFVNMSWLNSSSGINLGNAIFHQGLYLDTSNINGVLDLANSVFEGEVYLLEANISGTLILNGIQSLNLTEASGLDFRDMVVGRRLMMNGANLESVVTFEGSSIRRIECWDTTFGEWASFDQVVVELDAEFSGSSFSDADFVLFSAGRSADFSDVQFNGYADFTEANMERVTFQDAQFNGQLWLSEAQIAGNLDMSGAVFTSMEEPADLSHMRVGESILLIDVQAPGGLSMDRTRANELFIIGNENNPQIASLSLWLTQTIDQFVLSDVQIGTLDATGASFQGTTNISNVSISDEFILRNARLHLLVINSLGWPEDPEAFDMRGMTYADIDLGDGDLTEDTWKQLLYIVEESTYSPQAYRALAAFLTEKGHPDWANQVSLAMKRRERNEALAPFSAAWLWSWFLEIFAGYGYNPGLAFLWSALVVGAGAFVFRRKEDMLPVDQDEVKLHYHPLLYSFALFLPYIDLGIASKWEPNPDSKFPSTYKHIHRLLGWVLMPVALLAFSGILG